MSKYCDIIQEDFHQLKDVASAILTRFEGAKKDEEMRALTKFVEKEYCELIREFSIMDKIDTEVDKRYEDTAKNQENRRKFYNNLYKEEMLNANFNKSPLMDIFSEMVKTIEMGIETASESQKDTIKKEEVESNENTSRNLVASHKNLDKEAVSCKDTSEVFSPPIDPFTNTAVRNPVRNILCKHVYELMPVKKAVKMAKIKCPYEGCTGFIQKHHLVFDEALQKKIQNYFSKNPENTFKTR